ncbi:type II toxin-antitoxin system VapC family toxin [Sphingobium sp. AS12]|uniref:type II toxin-antitoxin system VapC family toxin n=1 Tax=Sphingobium sp. AS12 TaxID=2849495 RepID=UPI001C318A35|nr:type II toxin-antitoxin system VapC family toxin [Sphingobium sp. AS12]MBV2148739.1 type II toxin-antitoxin system VapC family toxin [Sphingobium sp. AS12]
MYLLDTNVCIDFLLGRSPLLAKRVGRAFGTLALSAITVAELRVGSRTSSDPQGDARRIDSFVAALPVIAFDEAAATTYAQVVRTIGVRRKSFDRLIGAQAVASQRILVTRNEADFADIPGLRIEDWTR